MTDFSQPQRMSPGGFFIYFLKYFKLLFNIAIIFLISKIIQSDGNLAQNLLMFSLGIGGSAASALLLASIAYFQIKFHVEGGNLIYRHRLVSRATTTIPLDRIHTLRTRQGILYRILGLRGVLFDTLAAKGEEIELILSESDWQSLLGQIERQEQTQTTDPDVPPAFNPSSVKKFSNEDLLLDALCQNHLKGMLVLGSVAAAFIDRLTELSEYTVGKMEGWFESLFNHFAGSLVAIALIMMATYLLSLALWLGKVILRYYDLSLTYDDKTLSFQHGLFSRMTTRFARDKICTIRIKRNILEKRMGLSTLSMRQALNASMQKEDDNLKIYGRDSSGFFLGWWLGDRFGSEAEVSSAKSGKGVAVRSLLPDLIISSAAIAALWHFSLYAWLLLPVVYLLVSVPKAILTMRRSRITLRGSYLIIGSGHFAETRNFLKYDNVEVVRITRTPLSRFTGRVSLSLSTSGTTFTVRSLRQDDASRIYELLLARSLESSSLPLASEWR